MCVMYYAMAFLTPHHGSDIPWYNECNSGSNISILLLPLNSSFSSWDSGSRTGLPPRDHHPLLPPSPLSLFLISSLSLKKACMLSLLSIYCSKNVRARWLCPPNTTSIPSHFLSLASLSHPLFFAMFLIYFLPRKSLPLFGD